MPTVSTTTSSGQSTSPTGGLTLDALMLRQKELAARAGDIAAPREMPSPVQGLAQMAQAFVNARQESTTQDQLTQGRDALAKIKAGINLDTGPTSEQISQADRLDPGFSDTLLAMAYKSREEAKTRQATLDAEKLKLDAAGQPKLSDIGAIRQDVLSDQAYKNMSNAVPIYKAMLETAGRDDLPSDLNLVYGIAKIMDPNSVVKEGEQITVRNAQGLGDKLMGMIAQVNGKATLGATARQQLLTEAYGRMQAYNDEYSRLKSHYTDIATRHNVDPRDVVDDFGEIKPYTPAPQPDPNNPDPNNPPKPPVDPSTLPSISGDQVDVFNKLPVGAQYTIPGDVDENGKLTVYTKRRQAVPAAGGQ